MTPYYENGWATLYHADSREAVMDVATLHPEVSAVITDPVWPNCPAGLLPGSNDPFALFSDVARHFPLFARRVVVQLGTASDPRFLGAVPSSLPFVRSIELPWSVPGYLGRVLNSADYAYLFGEPPPSVPSRRVIPGRGAVAQPAKWKKIDHPTPRAVEHVRWLLGWFSPDGAALDPFAGSGTLLVAAAASAQHAVGIEIEERWCEVAAKRLENADITMEFPREVTA